MMDDLQIKRSASLSKDGRYRWTLQRKWGDGGRICWIMLNPSTADATVDDPTIKRCMKFSHRWGYGSLVVVNLFPFRSSHPNDCRNWAEWERNGPDWYARDTIHHNEGVVQNVVELCDFVIAAWGQADWAQNEGYRILDELPPDTKLYCLGTSADGSPKHPLARGKHRIPDDQEPILWKVA